MITVHGSPLSAYLRKALIWTGMRWASGQTFPAAVEISALVPGLEPMDADGILEPAEAAQTVLDVIHENNF